ncbi:MAG: 5-oxoprolinase subunit PxpB [Oscillospiraceae bacterium]|jgi:KipI family sensor histidine kinase inhibitor|nr:5-oxoprolinase subunit PxpB [Oscillospiraceae bacterium]
MEAKQGSASSPVFKPCGDCNLSVCFGTVIAPEINARVAALNASIQEKPPHGVLETVPTYTSLLVRYDPCKVSYDKLCERLRRRSDAQGSKAAAAAKRTFVIPVCYGGAFGEDLPFVAAHNNLTEAEVIAIHTGTDYLIYMLGFLPGFAYLGGLDKRIHTPRLTNPRTKIPAGAVGIGGEQTGIYPLASPGGWQLIGQTPVRPYDPNRKEPILYQAGDRIRFRAVSAQEYAELSAQAEAGKAVWEVRNG